MNPEPHASIGRGNPTRVSGAAAEAYDPADDGPFPDGYAVVVDNGRSTLRPVTVGRDVGNGRVEILSGLASGERLARPPR